jgi:hypothetical protein
MTSGETLANCGDTNQVPDREDQVPESCREIRSRAELDGLDLPSGCVKG